MPPAVDILGMQVSPLTAEELLRHVEDSLRQRRGGWIVTANLDILWHFLNDAAAKDAYQAADIVVADGMPLVWAGRLQGARVPERVAGSSLCEPLMQMCARAGWPVCLLGGNPGVAERVKQMYRTRFDALTIAANSELRFGVPPTDAQLDDGSHVIDAIGARVVLVGLGSPKQEHVIRQLRKRHHSAWFVGIGGSFDFLANDVPRAPRILQRSGLEWAHRLALDPGRLGKRYLRNNLPLALRLLAHSATRRFARRR